MLLYFHKEGLIVRSNTHIERLLVLSSVVIAYLAITVAGASPAKAASATFTVTNINDSGAGSFRQAIIDANTNSNAGDMDLINFNIAGSGVHTISPSSALPSISEKVTIDGYSQPGASANTAIAPNPMNGTIMIEVDMKDAQNTSSMDISANDSILRGLALFSTTPISHSLLSVNASNVQLSGSYINVRADGSTLVDAQASKTIEFSSSYSGNQLGGMTAADRNIIGTTSTSITSGTVNLSSDNSTVVGNYFGLARDGVGLVAAPGTINSFSDGSGGLQVEGAGNTVGGVASGARNIFSGGTAWQLNVDGSDSIIQGNYVGTDYTGATHASYHNGSGVIFPAVSSGNMFGGLSAGQGNLVAGVAGLGVGVARVDIPVFSVVMSPNKNSILGNNIHAVNIFNYTRFGDSNMGIDLFSEYNASNPFDVDQFVFTNQGPTANDVGDSDTGPNNYMNTPVLKTAQQIGNQLTISYDLDTIDSPSNSYRVEFFANDESTVFGAGPGETYLGPAPSVTPGTNKTVTLTVSGDFTNKALSSTATAIDSTTASGFGSTSEFSKNISIGSATDFDSDGATDAVEDAGPNNGDANADGIPDRLQPTVTTYKVDGSSTYASFVTTGCTENGTVASIDVSSLPKQDRNFDYPFGMTDFSLNCSRGDTVNVTKYIFTNAQPSGYVARKYNPKTQAYTDVPGSTITTVAIGGVNALKLDYSITDGGALDDDATANGVIVDPVGLATVSSLANTGINVWVVMGGALTLIVCGAGAISLRRYR